MKTKKQKCLKLTRGKPIIKGRRLWRWRRRRWWLWREENNGRQEGKEIEEEGDKQLPQCLKRTRYMPVTKIKRTLILNNTHLINRLRTSRSTKPRKRFAKIYASLHITRYLVFLPCLITAAACSARVLLLQLRSNEITHLTTKRVNLPTLQVFITGNPAQIIKHGGRK